MFISTQVLAQSKDCLEMGILSDSSEKVTHCGMNSQQIAVKIEQASMHFISSWYDQITIESEVSQQELRNRETKVIFIKGILQESTNVWNLSTQEVAPQSAEHLEMETCPTSSEEVNDAKSCNLL